MLPLCDEMTSSKTGFELGNKLNIIKEVLKPNHILEGQVQESPDADGSMELVCTEQTSALELYNTFGKLY